jgi:hypothetical protein
MIINRILIGAAMMSLASAAFAASAEQTGTWLGTLKTSTFTPASKTVTKKPIQFEIAADNQTTVTVAGVPLIVVSVAYNATDALLITFELNGSQVTQVFGNFNFKGRTIKGGGSGIVVDGSTLVSTVELKYKLKKQ